MSKQISAINILSDSCPRGGPFQTQILIRLVISIRIRFTLLRSITSIINTAPAFGNRKDHINLASLLLTGWDSTGCAGAGRLARWKRAGSPQGELSGAEARPAGEHGFCRRQSLKAAKLGKWSGHAGRCSSGTGILEQLNASIGLCDVLLRWL